MLNLLATFLVVVGATVGILLLMQLALGGAGRGSWPQRLPVLAGGTPATHAWSRFHARYYPMTLLFVAFEMEMMFMYPWAVVYVEEGVTALTEMGMFLGILSLGVVYAWREGAFRWQ